MDEDPIKVAAARVRSTIRQAMRKITGETGTQANGAAEKAAGNAESAAENTRNATPARPPK